MATPSIIMAIVSKALRDHGADKEFVDKYFQESTAGNYDNLLRVATKFCKYRLKEGETMKAPKIKPTVEFPIHGPQAVVYFR